MEDSGRLYLSKNFPEVCDPGFAPGPCTVVVRTSKETTKGGVILPTSGRLGFDVGTVVVVGKKYKGTYQVGDKVGLRPGDGGYLGEFRLVHDRFDQHTGELLYDVMDQIPVFFYLGSPIAASGTVIEDMEPVFKAPWALIRRKPLSTAILTPNTLYSETATDQFGDEWLYRVTDENDLLEFLWPEEWGMTKDHALVRSECLLGQVKEAV